MSIIGISGRINSGKDTVGKIIQWLTKPEEDGEYIGFQTYDDYTLEKLSPFKIKKFAGKLKQIASLLTGIPVEKFEDQEFKKNLLDVEWGTVQDVPLNSIPPFADIQFNVMMSVREFLQKLGTEAMRNGLHQNVWVNALFADYKAKWVPTGDSVAEEDVSLEKEYPSWCITDMRFPNEMEAVVKRSGITIRVVRPVNALSQENHFSLLHPSETSLDSAEFDYTIVNDSTIEDLIEKVRNILLIEKII